MTEIGGSIPSSIGNYNISKKIGVGSFSSVWLGVNTVCNVEVAIKIIPKTIVSKPSNIIRFEREVSFLKQLDHPLIAQLFEILEDANNHYFVMELAQNGDLLSFVNATGTLLEQLAKQYFVQLVSVLEYMHNDKMIAHRDLKAENILLDKYNNIRLIDFGFSRQFTEDDPNLQTTCGSPAYIPPEMIKRQPYTIAADVWSLGVLLYAIVVGRLPFEDPENSVTRILTKIAYEEPYIPRNLSPELQQLLPRMLCKNPDRRITIEEIKAHPWYPRDAEERLNTFIRGSDDEIKTDFAFDEAIEEEMAKMGVDTTTLRQRLRVHEFDPDTAIYLMLKKRSMTESLRAIVSIPPAPVETPIPRAQSETAVFAMAAAPPWMQQEAPKGPRERVDIPKGPRERVDISKGPRERVDVPPMKGPRERVDQGQGLVAPRVARRQSSCRTVQLPTFVQPRSANLF